MVIAYVLGLGIGDPTQSSRLVQGRVSYHMLTGLGGLLFAMLVHAIVFTYFMGTGRWMEETTLAYKLSKDPYQRNQKLKGRATGFVVVCFLLAVATGALGGTADPASSAYFQGYGGLSSGNIHMLCALSNWGINLAAFAWYFSALTENSSLVNGILADVRRIRQERGLDT